MYRSQCHFHFSKQSWYTFFGIARSAIYEFFVISWIAWYRRISKLISIWEIRKSLPDPGQVKSVAKEAQFCSCWPKSHESLAMHELVHCHDGGTRHCFSTTEVFFSWHFLLDVSALRDNNGDSLFALDVRIHDAQHPRYQNIRQHDFHVRPDPLFFLGRSF
jgi:hypothetical protein